MSQNPLTTPSDLASQMLYASNNSGPATAEAQAAEIVKAMYGAFNFNQMQQLQAGLGMLATNPEAAAAILQQRAVLEQPAPAPSPVPAPVQAAAAVAPSAFNPFLFGHTPMAPGVSNQEATLAQAQTSAEIRERDADMDGEGPASQRARHQYRDPEKRREQNRQASQRARLRARQREEQVVVLQQQLQKMIGEMSSMKAELDDAKKKVECGQKMDNWRDARHGHPSRENNRVLNTL
uniref:BZIP domain-containing protein n=1 Tax=Pyramimonas obovata TaxID=1411642 RepID=A0A7S0WTW9_9CHLO|mmetsp:Transcript_3980/g.8196  ORF Transcript_3980/g.8196 Transcript_3980/m.8196 type:complete len:236 (+) Transcript_3980:107-814(+)|eukprot:CAMPEP_0118933274 /NCGR_PEP_ID=MMETSP1169-20130426/11861_1 /TAXON_ID=36882 /ORGANISM="Pyramimonas obovata, Strain CCMP722" /LENGTH=235 /DNA_ID=CAMNT_0006876013 /DNA_START=101 /DNA_END=808 /DNA_ORIENTATION=-